MVWLADWLVALWSHPSSAWCRQCKMLILNSFYPAGDVEDAEIVFADTLPGPYLDSSSDFRKECSMLGFDQAEVVGVAVE